MDAGTFGDWLRSQFYNDKGYFDIVSLSQVIIAIGIIVVGLVYKPWKLLTVWHDRYEKKRAEAVHSPPLSRKQKKALKTTTNLQLGLGKTGDNLSVDIYNYDHCGTARNIRVFLDDVPFREYPTRVGKARRSWALKPQCWLRCWIDISREPVPKTIRIICIAGDGTEHARSIENTLC